MVMFDPDHAASVLVTRFPEKAIELIADNCDRDLVAVFIRKACKGQRLDIGTVMSLGEGTVNSQLPVRTNPSVNPNHRHASLLGNPTSPLSPPPSSQASSPFQASPLNRPRSSSGNNEVVFALTQGYPPTKPLNARHAPRSYNLINQEIARERLQLQLQPLENPQQIPYNHGYIMVSEYVDLTWMRNSADKTHENTFFLVSMLEPDLVFGELNYEDLSQLHNGSCHFLLSPMVDVEANNP